MTEAEKRKAEELLRKRRRAAMGLADKPDDKQSDPIAEEEREANNKLFLGMVAKHLMKDGGVNPKFEKDEAAHGKAVAAFMTELMKYDIVLLSCEGSETSSMNQQALFDYAAAGGRVFASHFHYAWFDSGPFGSKNLATWSAGTNDMGDIGGQIVTTFPKGMALAQWLISTSKARPPYIVSQGTALGRAGRVRISTDADGAVWVGGGTVTCVSGNVEL